jgi:hypothetical protein
MSCALAGLVNAANPNPVRNAEFFATLGRVRGRRPLVAVPASLLRLMLGDLAGAFALASRLHATGYRFCLPDLENGLRHELAAIGPGSSQADNSCLHRPARATILRGKASQNGLVGSGAMSSRSSAGVDVSSRKCSTRVMGSRANYAPNIDWASLPRRASTSSSRES